MIEREVHLHVENSSDDRDEYTPRTLDLVFRNMERFIEGRPLVNRVSRKHQY